MAIDLSGASLMLWLLTTVDFSFFAPGLLLLAFPADRLLVAGVELKSFEQFRVLADSPGDRSWWRVPTWWLDPLRAFGGTYLIKIAAEWPPAWKEMPVPAYIAAVGTLVASVLLQLWTWRDPEALLAPIGFVAGIVAALLPWPVGVFGAMLGVTAMCALRQFQAFFAVSLVGMGVLGVFFDAEPAWLMPALGLMLLPFGASLITGRSLKIPTPALLPAAP